MSTIPNSAMPHAGPTAEIEEIEEGGETLTMARRAADLAQSARTQAGKLVDLARDNPKAAIAAGAVVAAGVAAAAAIPLVRSRRAKSGGSKAGGKTRTKASSSPRGKKSS